MKHRLVIALLFVFALGGHPARGEPGETIRAGDGQPYLLILGIAQDGGYPQAGCKRACCGMAWENASRRRGVASAAIVDPARSARWLIDATPDFREQLRRLDRSAPTTESPGISGIFLTHGHIGHYTGLMFLGREAMGSHGVPVYAMPRMEELLRKSGPWSQLVQLGNIDIRRLVAGNPVSIADRVSVTPLLVPHRDEFTETVAFLIRGPKRAALYLPDIDGWGRWSTSLESILKTVDAAYLDGTFYSGDELPGRDLSEIPHPLIVDTMKRLSGLPAAERDKVRFIHLNHTNPALDPDGEAARAIRRAGFHVAAEGERFPLGD